MTTRFTHLALVVYLRADPARLAERIRTDPQPRPLLGADPELELARMFDARDGWYAGIADRIEDVADADPRSIAQRVLDAFRLARPTPG